MQTDPKSVVVLFSGGIDSTYLMIYYLSRGIKVTPLFFFERTQTSVEIYEYQSRCVNKVYCKLQREFGRKLLSPIVEQWYDPIKDGDEIIGRHIVFLSYAVQLALSNSIRRIALGVYSDDNIDGPASYPDATIWFVSAYRTVLQASSLPIVLEHISDLSKAEVLDVMRDEYQDILSATRSCYNNSESKLMWDTHKLRGCGSCRKCLELIKSVQEIQQ